MGAIRNSIQAVISTSAVNARDHTGTAPANGSSYTTGEGVPIYWVGGAKAADNYGDFWDNTWDSTEIRWPNGNAAPLGQYEVWTGSNADGTKHATEYAGAANMRTGLIAGGSNQPISASNSPKTGSHRLYG